MNQRAAASFAGKRVLLTGHTGFKGAWLALMLARAGAQVTGFSLAPGTTPNLFDLAQVGKRIDSRIGDVRDSRSLADVVRETQPEVVFALAAQSIVLEGYAHPAATFATNVVGLANLLDALRPCEATRAIVVATSDKCYENREWPWPYRETDALGGHDPYAASKACSEIVVSAYRSSFFSAGAALATVRAGNVIGGGDWSPARLVVDLAAAAHAGEAAILRRPEAIRPWQFVIDALDAYLRLAARLLEPDGRGFAESWNVGPDAADARSVRDVARAFALAWGAPTPIEREHVSNAHEAGLLTVDSAKLRARLGWRPAYGIDETIARTVDWYRGWSDGVAVPALCDEEIARYESRVRTAIT